MFAVISQGRGAAPDAAASRYLYLCAGTLVPEERRNRVVELCGRLETLDNLNEIADAVGAAAH